MEYSSEESSGEVYMAVVLCGYINEELNCDVFQRSENDAFEGNIQSRGNNCADRSIKPSYFSHWNEVRTYHGNISKEISRRFIDKSCVFKNDFSLTSN